MVAPRSAPHSSSAAITAGRGPGAVRRGHLDAAEARPSRRRTPPRPDARPPIRAVTTRPSRTSTRRASTARGRRPDRSARARRPRARSGTACRRRGSPAPSRGRGTSASSSESGSTAATAGVRVRAGRRTRTDPLVASSAHARAAPNARHRVGPSGGRGGGASAAASRPSGSVTRSGQSASARSCGLARRDPLPGRGPRRHRLAGHDVGQPDLHRRRRPPAARRRHRRPRTVQTPSTSVIAGPPEGPVSPGSTRRTTTRCPTTWGPRPWASGGRRHAGILGCAVTGSLPSQCPRRNW